MHAHASTSGAHKPALAAQAFLTPARQSVEPLSEAQLGALFWIQGPAGRIAVRWKGKGPNVLLVHGWSGAGGDLAAFVQPLVDSGFRALTIDLPAHGQSDGDATSIPLAAQALLDVERAVGHLSAVIAHSVGAAVTIEALGVGLKAERAVLIGAPAHYINYARAVAQQAELDTDELHEMLAILRDRGIDVPAISAPTTAARLSQPALFIHSTDDRVVPIAEALESAAAWKGSRFMRVEGLGHRRVLQANRVIDAAISFISSTQE